MVYSTILLEKAEGIGTLTLNRPDKLNIFNQPMAEELLDAFTNIEQDSDIRVLVIAGAGSAFCAGADLKDLFLKRIEEKKRGQENTYDIAGWTVKACSQLRNMSKPTIASLHGHAVGVGITIPLGCDIRIAAEETKISFPFARVGIIPEFGSTYCLPRLVGTAKACELAFTGKTIDAREAKEIGLINEVVPGAELKAATYELANSMLQVAPLSIMLTKKAFYQGLDTDFRSQLLHEEKTLNTTLESEDHEEGVRAFLEKRKPSFKGK